MQTLIQTRFRFLPLATATFEVSDRVSSSPISFWGGPRPDSGGGGRSSAEAFSLPLADAPLESWELPAFVVHENLDVLPMYSSAVSVIVIVRGAWTCL
jgi:hypothetical protein